MFKQLFALFFLALSINSSIALAQNVKEPIEARGPSGVERLIEQNAGVVLVLAGGGAKGFAHLAVMQRLEQDNIPIKKIIGTSMGSVIGGLYASGLTVEQIKIIIQQVDPTSVALDQVSRKELPNRVKEYQQLYPIGLELGIKNNGIAASSGLSDGQRFLALLQREMAFVPANINFDQLKIPFRAVATRLRDGEMTVFKSGNLPYAIRASMAAPGVFSPFDIDGETYVDGGLVANIAVEVAKTENPNDIVIASYLGDKDLSQKVVINSPLQAASQMLDILMHQNEVRNLKMLSSNDILITPKVQDIVFTDFNRADEVINRGRAAVALKDNDFVRLKNTQSISKDAYLKRYGPQQILNNPITISQIAVVGNKQLPEKYIKQEISQQPNTLLDRKKLASDIENIYTSGNIESLDYTLNPRADGSADLQLNVNEKEYGPHFLKFGYGMYSDFSNINNYFLAEGYRRPWLTDEGLEIQVDTRIGSERSIKAALIQPISKNSQFITNVLYDSNYLPVYATQNSGLNSDTILYQVNIKQLVGNLGFVYDIDKNTAAKFKLFRGKYSINYAIGKNSLTNDSSFEVSGSQVQLIHDSLNSTTFPDSGSYFNALIENGFANSFKKTAAAGRVAFNSSDNVVNIGLEGGKIKEPDTGNGSPTIFVLGGFQSMGAYPYGQLIGDQFAHAEFAYMRRISNGLLGQTYTGFIAEYGSAWFASDIGKQSWHKQLHPSGTLFIGVDSKIGDIYLGYGKGTGNQSTVFLQLGKRISLF